MGLEVAGHENAPDWPKLGPSLLIATALILAIRTAKWPPADYTRASDVDLEREIDHASRLASRVLGRLLATKPNLFPQRKEPRFQPNGQDQPR